MLDKFLDFCRQNNLFEPNDSVLLSVSGGPDSIFMANLFNEIKNTFNLKLGIVYINHKMRDVKKEISFVKNISKEMGIPFYFGELIEIKKSSKEELLRIQRLKKLKEIAKKYDSNKIALAHTKDDQAETIIMRFLKGTALRGLSGIKPKSDEIFIHPILCFSREEILNFLKKKNICFFQDPTNYNFSFLRNKLRHIVIPFLEKEINLSLKENLVQMAENLLADENYLKEKAKESYLEIFKSEVPFPHFDRFKFLNLPKAIQKRIIISILKNFNFRWEANHIDLIIDFIENKPNKEAKFLNKYLTFVSTYDNIYICPSFVPEKPIFLKKSRNLKLLGWGSSLILSKKIKENSFGMEEKFLKKIKLTGMSYDKGFKKKMKQLKIPYPLRKYLPVFSIGNKIVWIPDFYMENIQGKNNIFMRWKYEFNKNP